MEIFFTPKFIRDFKSLEKDLQIEVSDKIDLFRDRKNHQMLKVHKLKEILKGRCSFSVNYQYRIFLILKHQKPQYFIELAIMMCISKPLPLIPQSLL